MLQIKIILCWGFLFFSFQNIHAQLFNRNNKSLSQVVSHQLRQQDAWNQQQQPVNSILHNLFAPVSEFPSKQPATYRVASNRTGQADMMQDPAMNNDNKFNWHPNRPASLSPYKNWLKKKRQREQVTFPDVFLENES